jgi:D-aspartate ligase
LSETVSNPATSESRPNRPTASSDGALIVGGDYRALGVARSLGRRQIPVYVLWEGEERIAIHSRYVQRNVEIEADREPLDEQLLRLAREEKLERWTLVPTGDRAVAAVARAHESLASVFRMTTPSWEQLRWAHDKRLLHQLAERLGMDSPWTVFPTSRADLATLDCDFPVILKPAFREEFNRFTAAKAWRADDMETLLARYDEAAALVPPELIMVQELIPGDGHSQLSFAALCREGEPLASVAARRLRQFPSDFGRASTYIETVDEPDVTAEGMRILAALGATGLFEVEFKRDTRNGTLKLLDVNPRAWGWHSVGARAGVDFPYLQWQLAHGREVSGIRGAPGVGWKRLSWDLMAVVSDARRGRFELRKYLRSFRRPQVSAIFAADDPLPAVLEFPILFRTLVSRLVRGAGV